MRSSARILEKRWSRQAVSRTIEAPVEHVWSAIADHQQWLTWYKPLKELKFVEGTELAVGTVVWEHEGPWKSTSEVLEFDHRHVLGTAMRTLNMRGLLSQYYRRIEVESVLSDTQPATEVTITGGFSFGPLGWILFPYTYPQMAAAMYFEYRSALKGLAEHVESVPR